MPPSSRPEIPDPVKRAVRQRCGFGCVLCGDPLCDYHHIVDWALTHDHKAEELTLLCQRHHRQVTVGLLPPMDVEAANQDPVNMKAPTTAPHVLHYGKAPIRLTIGTTEIINPDFSKAYAPIVIDGYPIIWMREEKGRIVLSMRLSDESGNRIFEIRDNCFEVSSGVWDAEFVGKRLTVRSGKGKIVLAIRFEPPDEIVIERALIFHLGVGLRATHDYLLVMNSGAFLSHCRIVGGNVGVWLGTKVPDKLATVTYFPIDHTRRFKYMSPTEIRQIEKQTRALKALSGTP